MTIASFTYVNCTNIYYKQKKLNSKWKEKQYINNNFTNNNIDSYLVKILKSSYHIVCIKTYNTVEVQLPCFCIILEK